MFYTYAQNNSYGRFEANDSVTQFVIIEARNAVHANKLAEEIGIYFDDSGDCECCGPRWSEMEEDSYGVDHFPVIYGNDPVDYYSRISVDWFRDASQAYCYVYYADGRKIGYFYEPKTGIAFSGAVRH